VLLGNSAVRALRPATLAAAAFGTRTVFLAACDISLAPEVRVAWNATGVSFLDPFGLERALEERTRRPVRFLVGARHFAELPAETEPTDDGPERRTRAPTLLGAVLNASDATVGSVCAALGPMLGRSLDARSLHRMATADLGRPLAELVHRYRCVLGVVGVLRGLSLLEAAHLAGYTGRRRARSLERALDAAGVVLKDLVASGPGEFPRFGDQVWPGCPKLPLRVSESAHLK
jgi:hypothetical protein